jgi:H+-transporting ATPase
MSSTTDNVRPSDKPNAWRIDHLTIAGCVLALCNLIFCVSILAVGRYELHLDPEPLRTLTVIISVFSGQATFYTVRERRRLWSSRPSRWIVVSSIADVLIFVTLASRGILMNALPIAVVAATGAAAVAFALVLDAVKVSLFRRLSLT